MKCVLTCENGLTVTGDFTVAEISELLESESQPSQILKENFYESLSARERLFLQLVKDNPGITSTGLAIKIGFQNPMQLGGLAGGGIAKLARKYGIRTDEVYKCVASRENGVRVARFYPGPPKPKEGK